jgi:hypothetical protein
MFDWRCCRSTHSLHLTQTHTHRYSSPLTLTGTSSPICWCLCRFGLPLGNHCQREHLPVHLAGGQRHSSFTVAVLRCFVCLFLLFHLSMYSFECTFFLAYQIPAFAHSHTRSRKTLSHLVCCHPKVHLPPVASRISTHPQALTHSLTHTYFRTITRSCILSHTHSLAHTLSLTPHSTLTHPCVTHQERTSSLSPLGHGLVNLR